MTFRTQTFLSAALLSLFSGIAPGQSLTPEQAQRRLDDGNARFAAGRSVNPRSDATRRHETAEQGQHPFATILACADSRVPVERIFDQGVGDVFVIRVAGNICDNDEAATIEYGTGHLKTPLLVVMGHSRCGAVTAAVNETPVNGQIRTIIDQIDPAVRTARQQNPQLKGDALIDATVQANVMHSIAELLTESEEVRGLVQEDRLRVVGAVYDVLSGRVNWLGRHPDEKTLLKDGPGNTGEREQRSRVLGKTVVAEPAIVEPTTTGREPITGQVSGDAALSLLRDGNKRFSRGAATHPRSDKACLTETACEQHPFAALLSCSDSRVPPSRLFDQGFGDLFEVRVAGNVADTTEVGSLEYAAEHLHAPLLVVLGHSACGAVTAVARHTELHGHLPKLVENIGPALESVQKSNASLEGDDLIDATIRANVRQSIGELRKRSALIRGLEQSGQLKIVGALYNIESGSVEWFDSRDDASPELPAKP